MSEVCNLTDKHCKACEGGVPKLSESEAHELLKQLKGWQINAAGEIMRRYAFKDFYQTMAFMNAVAWIANVENHHPDVELGYNYCVVRYLTHAVDGLTENDFICAAKIDALMSV